MTSAASEAFEATFEIRLGGENDEHAAALREFLHEPGAFGDQSQAVFETEDAGDVGGGVFADAVAEHGGRLDAPALPQVRE